MSIFHPAHPPLIPSPPATPSTTPSYVEWLIVGDTAWIPNQPPGHPGGWYEILGTNVASAQRHGAAVPDPVILDTFALTVAVDGGQQYVVSPPGPDVRGTLHVPPGTEVYRLLHGPGRR